MNCKNCGHGSHCGVPKYARDLNIKIDGIPDMSHICEHCSCALCEKKVISVKQYVKQYKLHEEKALSTVERNNFWKNIVIKD